MNGNSSYPERLLTTEQAAALLSIKPQTLVNWRCTKRHPLPFVRIGSCVRYRSTDLTAWIEAHRVNGDGM